MVAKKIAIDLSNRASVAGIVDSEAALDVALRMKRGALDFFEIRVDAFAGREEELLRRIARLKLPLIITVRHPAEGGKHALPLAKRRALFEKFLPHAAFIDIELRSVKSMAAVMQNAAKRKTGVILSHHDFQGMPSPARLRGLARKARNAGANVFKAAATTSSPADVETLLAFQRSQKAPLSLMGMGKYGKVSRLLLAEGGSVLNYGFLKKANVPGQWAALELKKRIKAHGIDKRQ